MKKINKLILTGFIFVGIFLVMLTTNTFFCKNSITCLIIFYATVTPGSIIFIPLKNTGIDFSYMEILSNIVAYFVLGFLFSLFFFRKRSRPVAGGPVRPVRVQPQRPSSGPSSGQLSVGQRLIAKTKNINTVRKKAVYDTRKRFSRIRR
ncbi:hypothetical protein GOV04_04540 [Candidatus Woesearchaeota archaeon]|nr:hypothetical protein [Candidatus Woesearchaeota archaeon]